MTLYCKRWKPEDVELTNAPSAGAWELYSVIGEAPEGDCDIVRDLQNFEVADLIDARRDLQKIMKRLDTGQPLERLFDPETQCHIGHEYEFDRREITIRRFRLSKALRFYFVYQDGRKIVLLKAAPKRKDKLSEGEKQTLETLCNRLLNAIKENSIEFLD